MAGFGKILKKKIKQADFLLGQGRASEAVSELKEAMKFSQNESYLHYLLGVARLKCGRFFLAKQALEKANQLLPENAENLRTLGWAMVMLGDLEQGRKNLRESINLDLTNPLAYLDLAMSHLLNFEFEQGLDWMERAKALNPEDPFILDNYKIAKESEKEFLQYSKSQREKLKKDKLDPKNQKMFRIAALERFLSQGVQTEDEFQEITEELKLNGLPGQITIAKPGSDHKGITEYIKWHNQVDNVEKKLTGNELSQTSQKLFSETASLAELKTCILRLAHQGTNESLKLLKKFEKKNPEKLKTWIEMAIGECQSFF
jgi:Flp pilus assembly protein TadD